MKALAIRDSGGFAGRIPAEARGRRPARPVYRLLRWALCFVVYVGLALFAKPSIAADETAGPKNRHGPRKGVLLRVSAPITSSVTARVTNAAEEFIAGAKLQGKWPIVIFEFEPGESAFEDALKLANRITQMSGATTVAYVANDEEGEPLRLRGHAVLAVLACDQLALHPDAWIGEANAFEKQLGPVMKMAYAEVARSHGPISVDLAVSLLDPALEIKRVKFPGDRHDFVRTDRIVELRKTMTFQVEEKNWVEPGKTGLLSGLDFVSMGLMDRDNLVKDRTQLALALGLPPEAVEDDPFWDDAPRAVIFPITGRLKSGAIHRIQDKIQSKIDEEDLNLIIFEINSAGGVPEESMNLAKYLIGVLDPSQRRTVAYITSQAAGDATFIAMACDHVILLPEAELGGSGSLSIEEIKAYSDSLAAVAKLKGRSGSLASALIDPSIVVFRYDRDDGEVDAYFSEDEAKQHATGRWLKGDPVTEKGQPLKLTAERARELRLATNVVQSYDDLKEFYSLTYDPPRIAFDWLDFILAALTRKEVLAGLLWIGIVAFYAEMHSPGSGVGGFIAACCFLLYFWGNFLEGRADWLEILMFLVGLVLILLEVFVIPGFGIIGIGGGILVVLSVIMAMQTFRGIPSTDRDIIELRDSLAVVTFAAIGAIFGAMALRRFLPVTPGLRDLVLVPSGSADGDAQALGGDPAIRLDHLVGEIGVSVTQLTPSGKARVGNQILDVVTEGEVIERGEMVRVIQTQGNRIVVQASR